MDDKEDIQDRVISNERLIEILGERDNRIYKLELELSQAKYNFQRVVEFFRFINSSPID